MFIGYITIDTTTNNKRDTARTIAAELQQAYRLHFDGVIPWVTYGSGKWYTIAAIDQNPKNQQLKGSITYPFQFPQLKRPLMLTSALKP